MFKQVPEDFEVEEVPSYLPSGAGSHLFLWIEKRGCTTPDVAQALGRAFGVRTRDVGSAGLKDRQAVARQWFSVPTERTDVPAISVPGAPAAEVRVLAAARHQNKLRTGQLRGNRFHIRLRGAGDLSLAREALAFLHEHGAPNWFGPQRFGRAGDNADLGRALLSGGSHPMLEKARRDRFLRRLALSAFQSALFNRSLGERMSLGLLCRAEHGDLLQIGVDGRGPLFLCEEPEIDGPRCARFEVSPTGPLFGARMPWPSGDAGRRERELFTEQGLSDDLLARGGGELTGGRRAYRVRPFDAAAERVEDGIRLSFALPRGAYATSVLRELLKTD
jgi:tRNA pseudouridine13 synthase